jgi:hypothetical protein
MAIKDVFENLLHEEPPKFVDPVNLDHTAYQTANAKIHFISKYFQADIVKEVSKHISDEISHDHTAHLKQFGN